jgi:hypothetical protein
LVTPFITIPITCSCNLTQLLLTPLHNYNSCAFVPTITYCTVTLLTIDSLCCRSSILRLDLFFSCQLLTALFAGWLTRSLPFFSGSLAAFLPWLTRSVGVSIPPKVAFCRTEYKSPNPTAHIRGVRIWLLVKRLFVQSLSVQRLVLCVRYRGYTVSPLLRRLLRCV